MSSGGKSTWQQWTGRDQKWLSRTLRRIEEGMWIWGMQVTPEVMVASSFPSQWREVKRGVRTQQGAKGAPVSSTIKMEEEYLINFFSFSFLLHLGR